MAGVAGLFEKQERGELLYNIISIYPPAYDLRFLDYSFSIVAGHAAVGVAERAFAALGRDAPRKPVCPDRVSAEGVTDMQADRDGGRRDRFAGFYIFL